MTTKKNRKKVVNKSILFTKLEIVLLIISFVTFSLLALLVATNNIKWFDSSIYSVVSKMICKPMTIFFKWITMLFDTETVIGMLVALLIFSINKKWAALVSLNTGLCVGLNQIVKHIFLRNRPVGIALIKQGGYSFPSGHSMISFAFIGLFIYMVLSSNLSKGKKVLFTTLLSLLILIIGISRIYLGVHFASDVLAGFALSCAYLIIFINLVYKKIGN